MDFFLILFRVTVKKKKLKSKVTQNKFEQIFSMAAFKNVNIIEVFEDFFRPEVVKLIKFHIGYNIFVSVCFLIL